MSRRNNNLTIRLVMEDPNLELCCEVTATPYDPGVSSGPVEACYPPEGGEVEINEIWLTGVPGVPDLEISPLITLLDAHDKLQELVEQAVANLPSPDYDGPENYED